MLKILISFVMVVAVEAGLNYDGYLDFKTTNVTGDFEKAKSGCNSSALAVVRDSATQMALTEFLNRSNPNSLLYINIKLHRNASDTWFLVNGTWYSGSLGNQDNKLDEYKLYGYLKPYPDNKAEFLVEVSKPTHLRNFICDFGGSTCPNNLANNYTFKERCFVKYEDENLTWYKARESCFNKGGDLAKFQSGSNPWIAPFNTSWLNSSLTYWIGIRYNDWSWKSPVDDKEVINTFWSNGKPNNNNYECVCVDPNGSPAWSWTDCNCTVERPFVCLKIIPTATATTTTVATTETISATTTSTSNTNLPTTDTIYASMSCKSDALVFGLVLGVILPLTIVLIVLTVIIVHQQREKNRSDGSVANQRLSVQDRSRMQDTVPETPYQHLQKDSEPVTTIPIYDQLNQSPNQEYESTSERT